MSDVSGIAHIRPLSSLPNNTSTTTFRKVWGQKAIPDTSDIHEPGQGIQFVRLAWETFNTSNELHYCCHRANRDLDRDLELKEYWSRTSTWGVWDQFNKEIRGHCNVNSGWCPSLYFPCEGCTTARGVGENAGGWTALYINLQNKVGRGARGRITPLQQWVYVVFRNNRANSTSWNAP